MSNQPKKVNYSIYSTADLQRWVNDMKISQIDRESIREILDLRANGAKQIIPITEADIIPGAEFKTATGTVWIIDEVQGNIVCTSMRHGKKGNYRNEISDCVDFLNEESAIKL